MKRTAAHLLAFCLCSHCFTAIASDLTKTEGEQLLAEMLEQIDLSETGVSVPTSRDCVDSDVRSPAIGWMSQYIFNSHYRWTEIQKSDGICIHMLAPISRLLSGFEAEAFVAAQTKSFPVPQTHISQGEVFDGEHLRGVDIGIDIDNPEPKQKNRQEQERKDPASKSGVLLANTTHPWNALTLVRTSTNVGSAVQISPYVYATAAHNVVSSPSGQLASNIKVFPSYRVPSVTTSIDVAAVDFDPTYITSTPNARLSRDLAFLRTNKANPRAAYPIIFHITELRDVPNNVIGNPLYDPWVQTGFYTIIPGCVDSWQRSSYNVGSGAPAICYPGSPVTVDKVSVGYPDFVGTTNNTVRRDPYASAGQIWGGPLNRSLFWPSGTYSNPVISTSAAVSSGQSGGPIFGHIRQWVTVSGGHQQLRQYVALLGIVTNSVITNPYNPLISMLGTGDFGYNWRMWDANLAWNPNSFWGDPNPAITSTGSANWMLRWNAPGYTQLDVYGHNYMEGGAEVFLGTVGSSGANPHNHPVGFVGLIKFYPKGDRSFELGRFTQYVISQ